MNVPFLKKKKKINHALYDSINHWIPRNMDLKASKLDPRSSNVDDPMMD